MPPSSRAPTLAHAAAAVTVAWLASPALAQVIAVDQIEQSWLVRSEPTLTALRPAGAPQPRAVLVLMPGGEGQIGLRPDTALDTPPRNSFAAMMRRLVDPLLTSGALHVVSVDSPYSLGYGAQIPLRATRDHLVRMESVAQFYRARLGLPVWVMGHSNGGYSVAEFVKHLKDRNKEDLVAGLIFSAARTNSYFGGGPFQWPTLFVVSAEDGCMATSAPGNEGLYLRFKERNTVPTEFVLVRSAQPEASDPCRSGTHMYHRAEEEVAKILDDFVARHTPPHAATRRPALTGPRRRRRTDVGCFTRCARHEFARFSLRQRRTPSRRTFLLPPAEGQRSCAETGTSGALRIIQPPAMSAGCSRGCATIRADWSTSTPRARNALAVAAEAKSGPPDSKSTA